MFDESLLLRDAGADAGDVDGGVTDAGCVPRKPPARPSGTGMLEASDTTYALKDVVLDQGRSDRWRSIGYDFDDLCSERTSTMVDPEVSCLPPSEEVGPESDGVSGIDNVFGHRWFPPLVVVAERLGTFDEEQQLGHGVLLVRVKGWNGEPNDSRVDVVVANAAFGTADPPPGGEPDPTTLAPPAWEGMDAFWADDGDFLDGEESMPFNRDDNAYVADGVLVVALTDRHPIVFVASDGSRLELRMTEAVLTGRISATGLADVTIAGMWSIVDATLALPALGFCPGTMDNAAVTGLLDETADLDEGGGGVGARCDSLSVGILLTGYPVMWAGVVAHDLPTSPCE